MLDWTLHFKKLVVDNSFFAIVASFWGGVLASFTPCTYPVIPITVAFLGHQVSSSKSKLFLISFVYATGLAVVYASLGIFASLTGRIFGSWAGNKLLYIIVGNVCILASLVMFGVIPFRIPSFIRFFTSKLSGTNTSGIVGSFIMGATSAFVIGPCTTPILGVLLSIAATGKSLLKTSLLLLSFSYGLSLLVVLAGIFTGLISTLPRAGKWLKLVQNLFALLMVAVGEYFLYKAGVLSSL